MPGLNVSDFTVGVEEEYQLVDSVTGELRSRARAVLESDWSGEIKQEMQQTAIEVGTKVCTSAMEVRQELGRLRFHAAVAAESRGLRVVAAGLHPFAHWEGQEFTREPVYEKLRREYRRLADSQNIFGLHVHVAVPEQLDRVVLMNSLRRYVPLILALSGSSPLYLGDDTGYNSYRSILWGRWPRTGSPPRFRDQAEYDDLVKQLIDTDRIDGPGRIYWAVRPHHVYPTIEFRAADVTPRLDHAVGIATLLRALTFGVASGVIGSDSTKDSIVQPFMSENIWRAARDGVEALLVQHEDGKARVVRVQDTVEELIALLRPSMPDPADAMGWEAISALAATGGGAERIREKISAGSGLPEVVLWLADETVLGVGLDRRQEQRDAG